MLTIDAWQDAVEHDEMTEAYAPTHLEPTHSDDDENYYTHEILAGWHDYYNADPADWLESLYDPDVRIY